MIKSPCLGCIRETKDKRDCSCINCEARSDFTLATQGDEDAFRRYKAFVYPDLGMSIVPSVKKYTRSQAGRKAATEEYYQQQYFSMIAKINRKYKTKFKTVKDVVIFLYDKYKNQRYIAIKLFGVSHTVVSNMLKVFDIRVLSMSESSKIAHSVKKGIDERRNEAIPTIKDMTAGI